MSLLGRTLKRLFRGGNSERMEILNREIIKNELDEYRDDPCAAGCRWKPKPGTKHTVVCTECGNEYTSR